MFPAIPLTVTHRAPVRPIQRPAKPAIRAVNNGIKTIATNIFTIIFLNIFTQQLNNITIQRVRGRQAPFINGVSYRNTNYLLITIILPLLSVSVAYSRADS